MSKASFEAANYGGDAQVQIMAIPEDYELDTHVDKKWQGNAADMHDMSVLGRKQQLRRNFHFISILGFASTLICTWEVILTTLNIGLTDGGTAGIFWGYIVVVVAFTLVYASIAEMASMAPTSGGQYHWVSEFAPRSCQKYLSYITGWLCFVGWQTAIVAIAFLAGTIIQGLIALNDPSYVFERWHGTLLVIAVSAFSIIFNTFLATKLPLVEGLVLVLHILGVFIIVIPLWILAPRNNAHAAFTEFTNLGGWPTTGTSFMIGLLTSIGGISGFDCQVHMSEEVKNASLAMPRALMYSMGLNSTLGFILVVTIIFTVGEVHEILNTPTGQPFIQIFFNGTNNSYAGTNVMTGIIIITLTASVVAEIATASRQLWSFARDNGVPFSRYLSRVTPGWNIPLNAVLVSLVVTILLSLINIGNTVALQAILSASTGSLMTSYIISISCILNMRIRGQPLPARRWSLGRWGLPINALALCFIIPIFIFQFFPVATPVTAVTMNYGSLIYGAMIFIATVYYFSYGKKQYIPPVALVKRDIY